MADIDGVKRGLHIYDQEARNESGHPPLIILSGTAQSIQTWAPHVNHFSKNRRLIIPELRGQGATELLSKHGDLNQQIQDLHELTRCLGLTEIGKLTFWSHYCSNTSASDIVGFSFGGRAGIGLASKWPRLVNKLSITGVPLVRPVLGKLILQSWKESLQSNNPKAAAWSCIINGCSPEFLTKYERAVPDLVTGILHNNDTKRMCDLISHATSPGAELITKEHAQHVLCPTQVIASRGDRLAGMGSEKDLADAIRNSIYHEISGICGHMSPFEQPVQWRNLILDFMGNGKDTEGASLSVSGTES